LFWCTGEDSNLRSSQGAADLQSAAINRSATCAHTPSRTKTHPRGLQTHPRPNTSIPAAHCRVYACCPTRRTSGIAEHAPQWDRRGGQVRHSKNHAPVQTFCRFQHRFQVSKWSWRRDLNPRPSDYKSDALPAELRQPKDGSHNPQNRFATRKSAPETGDRRGHTPAPRIPRHSFQG
jgi:hypothetical protein